MYETARDRDTCVLHLHVPCDVMRKKRKKNRKNKNILVLPTDAIHSHIYRI